jgi:alpha-glucosidase (family GH31 glycosyl hydrolase)
MIRLFIALEPYRRELMLLAQNKGYPLVRALFMHFPGDEACNVIDDEVIGDATYG